MNNNAKFDFFVRVIIMPTSNESKFLYNIHGTVLGKAHNPNIKLWTPFPVIMMKDYSWQFQEHELKSLGYFAKREDYYSGENIKVVSVPDNKGDLVGMLKEEY